MITNIRYSLVVFGQFEDMTPNRDLIQQFSTLLSQYDMDSGVSIETEFTSQGIQQYSGLRFFNKDGSLLIEFKRNSMEISYVNSNINVVKAYDYPDFRSFVSRVISMEPIKSRRFKRIGFIHHIIMEGVDHSVAAKKLVGIPFYDNLKMRDDWSLVWPAATELSDKTLINVHTKICRGKRMIQRDSKQEALDGIDLVFDVNTFRENTDYKYNTSNLLDMCDKLHQKEVEVGECVTNQIMQ